MQALTLFLAALLGASALHKLLARERLVPVTARLAGAALPSGTLLLALAATLEGLAALALLVPALRPGGALAALALWLGYALVLGHRHGQVLDCGCDLVAREKPVDGIAIARPVLLAVLASALLFGPAPVWTLDAPFAALALLALWFAAGELHSIPKLKRSRP
jgi:hypothetical protein